MDNSNAGLDLNIDPDMMTTQGATPQAVTTKTNPLVSQGVIDITPGKSGELPTTSPVSHIDNAVTPAPGVIDITPSSSAPASPSMATFTPAPTPTSTPAASSTVATPVITPVQPQPLVMPNLTQTPSLDTANPIAQPAAFPAIATPTIAEVSAPVVAATPTPETPKKGLFSGLFKPKATPVATPTIAEVSAPVSSATPTPVALPAAAPVGSEPIIPSNNPLITGDPLSPPTPVATSPTVTPTVATAPAIATPPTDTGGFVVDTSSPLYEDPDKVVLTK